MGNTVDTTTLATILDVTPRRIQQMAKEGMPSEGRNRWDLVQCLHWYIRYLRQSHGGDDELRKEKIRIERIRADTKQMELQEKIGSLVQVEEVTRQMRMILVAFKAEIFGLSGRLANSLAAVDDPGQVKVKLDEELRETFNRLSDNLNNYAKSCGNGSGSDEGSTEEESEPVGRDIANPATGQQ